MAPRLKQQLGGFLIALLSAAFTAWTWSSALHDGYFYEKARMLFPAFFVLGVALIFFPGYKEERIARGEKISGMQGWELITPRWWAVFVAALAAAIGNYVLRSRL